MVVGTIGIVMVFFLRVVGACPYWPYWTGCPDDRWGPDVWWTGMVQRTNGHEDGSSRGGLSCWRCGWHCCCGGSNGPDCCGGDDDCGVGSGWDGGSGGGAGVTFGTIVQRPTGFPILGQSYQ